MTRLFLTGLAVLTASAAAAAAPIGLRTPSRGVEFNGRTSYAVAEKAPAMDGTALTVSAWVKLRQTGRPQIFVSRGGAPDLFTFYLFRGRVRMLVAHVPGQYTHANTDPPKANEWTHYAGTYDGRAIKVYTNGELKHTARAEGGIAKSDEPLYVGALSPVERHLDGWMEDVRLWRRALSDPQVAAAAAGSADAALGEGLLARWTEQSLEGGRWRNTAGDALHLAYHADPKPVFLKADGYRGIWYCNQRLNNEYVYKYSGGLGTYCAKHIPFACYAEAAKKTFFCYGGTRKDRNTLLHMVSYYDHTTGEVPRPTILLDKRTTDAHDNPVMQIDAQGYVWVFSSSHGRGRPSFIHRSAQPYSVDAFERVLVTNFSYPQAHYVSGRGFLFLHTLYLGGRLLHQWRSPDGHTWGEPQLLSRMAKGHYQISSEHRGKVGTAFNYHPSPRGLNWRTNLYYMQTRDFGDTWLSAQGEPLTLPLSDPHCPALVRDYEAEGLMVYMKDLAYDAGGHPIILYITSKGFESGPKNDPRTWTTARWTGSEWDVRGRITSDNNYDMGSLYVESDGRWRIIGPTQPGPQPYNPGGEVALWTSTDQGATWRMEKQLTRDSEFNHTYVRRPVNAHPAFYAFWADGHGRQPSESRLYFTDKAGSGVWRLPTEMDGESAAPERVW